jgi:hypothetical protein
VAVMTMFVATFTATWFPGGRDWLYVLQPVSAALFFAERLLRAGPQPEPHTFAARPELPQAA